MTNRMEEPRQKLTIHDLYPDQSEDWLKEAEENLERYLELVLRIYQRLREDPEDSSQFQALTASGKTSTLERERSNNEKDTNSSNV